MLLTAVGALIQLAPVASPPADPLFLDRTAATGIVHTHHDAPSLPGLFAGQNSRFGAGGAVSDYDGDGDQDLYLCDSAGYPNRLFQNQGDGTFVDVAQAAGVEDIPGYGHMALFVDLDNDGWDDLVVINDYNTFDPSRFIQPCQLFRNNGDGSFTNVTLGSGFAPEDSTFGGATAGDYDHDGDLDLVVVGWYDWSTWLFRNDGDFQFTDVTADAGIDPGESLAQWTPILADFDDDGWSDLYCAVDFKADYLLHNLGNGSFLDVSIPSGATHVGHDMGAAVGDFDRDLDLDIYTTNISGPKNCEVEYGCNYLYVNDGDGVFTDGTEPAGVGDTYWGWGTTFADVDLDGDLDLYSVNGWYTSGFDTDPATFFQNDGTGVFEERGESTGMAYVGDSRTLIPIDLERDGDVDFVITDARGETTVLANITPRADRHWIVVEAEGVRSNRNGVGARVFVTAGGVTRMEEIIVGGSFYASPAIEAHFGLGDANGIDEVVVRFPTGDIVRRCEPERDAVLHVREPASPWCAGDLDESGTVDVADILALLASWGPCGGCCPADRVLDRTVDVADLLSLLATWGPCAG